MKSAGLRAESSDGTFIFRPDQQVLWILNSAGKEYRQITESDLGEMNSQMNDAMKKMEADRTIKINQTVLAQLTESAR